ncbi:hypothetical protein [Ruegeria arenilitoris]|uniref:hypothetical protein n=1 Tax=Ruegeria arenilitoris TaxID=1173585 RepID=UPI001480C2B5|nr:hypothetical protein [Ruegeria arenilitoris]
MGHEIIQQWSRNCSYAKTRVCADKFVEQPSRKNKTVIPTVIAPNLGESQWVKVTECIVGESTAIDSKRIEAGPDQLTNSAIEIGLQTDIRIRVY